MRGDYKVGYRKPPTSTQFQPGQSRKGLVTDVSGPQRNACPGTLTL